MNRLLLAAAMFFSPVYRKFGADTNQLRIILSTKMLMDDRRPVAFGGNKNGGKNSGYSTWITMAFLAITGTFFALVMISVNQPYLGHTIYFSACMVMLAMTLISDFTTVLIDSKDQFIILPRPVNDVTFSLSRILHIGLHVFKMAISLMLPGFLFLLIGQGMLAGLVFLLQAGIATVLSVFIVNAVYLAVLRILSPSRFKGFIAYFQIVFSVLIFAAYYMLPRLVDSSMIKGLRVTDISGIWLLPPVWIAALNELIRGNGTSDATAIWMAAAALLSPVCCLVLLVKVLAPGFMSRISGIHGSEERESGNPASGGHSSGGMVNRLSDFFARDPAENAGFRLTWHLTSRFRDFRVKVYPSFAYVPVYFVYFGFINRKEGTLAERWEQIVDGQMYILLIYLCALILTTVLHHISYTDKYKASWIFFTAPHNMTGRILAGMYKAVVVKYFLPYFLLIAVFSFIFWGAHVLNDLLLAFSVCVFYGILTSLYLVKGLPFSQPPIVSAGGKFWKTMLILSVPALIGYVHFTFAGWEYLIWAAACAMSLFAWVTFRHYREETWESLEIAA